MTYISSTNPKIFWENITCFLSKICQLVALKIESSLLEKAKKTKFKKRFVKLL